MLTDSDEFRRRPCPAPKMEKAPEVALRNLRHGLRASLPCVN
jgi:hypothetical protein